MKLQIFKIFIINTLEQAIAEVKNVFPSDVMAVIDIAGRGYADFDGQDGVELDAHNYQVPIC